VVLYEIRILGKDNIRIIYVGLKSREVLVLHGFIKKRQKTSQNDIQTAVARFEEWIRRSDAKS